MAHGCPVPLGPRRRFAGSDPIIGRKPVYLAVGRSVLDHRSRLILGFAVLAGLGRPKNSWPDHPAGRNGVSPRVAIGNMGRG